MLIFYTTTPGVLEMKRPFIAVLLSLALSPAQAREPQKAAGASLAGIVVRAGTSEPLAGAQAILTAVTPTPASNPSAEATAPVVSGSSDSLAAGSSITTVSASAVGSRKIAPVTTDRDGRFVFQDLDPGLYSLQVLRNGYARHHYGQRITGGPATAIRLSAGQVLPDIVMPLVPAGNVAGMIRGSDGQPQTGVPIQLLRATYNAAGLRTFHVEGTAKTNDRGEYRLYWITPGRYYLSAGSPSGPNRPLAPNTAASPNEIPDQSFALTYFPGVFDAAAAAVIDVNSGVEMNGVDFVAPRQQLYSVRGRIVDSTTGRPPATASVSLAYKTLTGVSGAFNSGTKYDAATGDFELRNVPPGSYVVQAIAASAAPVAAGEALVRISAMALQANARAPITVSNGDVNGVTLQLAPGVSVPGRITVDGTALSQTPGWERIRIQLKPTVDSSFAPNLQPAQPIAQKPLADGSFAIDGLTPGEFALGPITGLPQGVYVKEARFNQVDVLGQPLRFSGAGSGALEIVLSSKAGQLDGTVIDAQTRAAAGAQIVLVPERDRQRTDLYRTAASDSAGRFVLRGIPPGEYRVFGWEALESYAYFDSELLRRVEAQGIPVRVSESAANSLTLKIIPASR
jgi:hypothetical protein